MKSLSKILLFFLLQFSVKGLNAQQLPLYSQYIWNDYVINPAYTGSLDYSPIRLTYRKQWAGFNGSPELFTAGGHTRINNKISLGGIVFKDATGGAITQTGALINYCYRLKLSTNSNLAFALSGQVNQYTFDNNKVQALMPNDPALLGDVQKSLSPDASFGMLFQRGNKTKIGVSVNQLFESRLSNLDNTNSENTLVRHFNVNASQLIQLDSNFTLEPAIWIKKTIASPFQADMIGKLNYKNNFSAGINYRYNDAIVGFFSFNIKNIFIGYSYDASISAMSSYSNGSHEIILGYNFMKK
ncbi:MAG: type IX secretion system membrane protein PorP/SprF [Bacteroidetes bacterium]|nr:type IX secretion system membrane protein PorP/SprF [Bacteroidota bacterium]